MERVTVLFPTADSRVSPAGADALTAALARTGAPQLVLVSGYADSDGSEATNRALSERRASAVRDHLLGRGIEASRMQTHAFGEANPVAPNDTEEGRQRNRRVEVQIFAAGDRLPSPTPGDTAPTSESSAEHPDRQESVPLLEGKVSVAADTPWVEGDVLAPARLGNDVVVFVDGADYMRDLADAIDRARHRIYIADWIIHPAIRLRRPGTVSLLDQLAAAARRGVQVRVVLYQSLRQAYNYDQEAERDLEAAHRNVRVSRHNFATFYSHHQKFVVLDDGSSPEAAVAYLGGVDLASGRFDTPAHPLTADPTLFRDHTGRDVRGDEYYDGEFYNNDLDQGELFANGVGAPLRARFPRLPWHDIHIRVRGPSVFDVEANFVQRWNFQRGAEAALTPSRAAPGPAAGNVIVQVTRSAAPASAGIAAREDGILRSYLRAIQHAQHHIYIEQQFFTSNFGGGPINNRIMDAIASRIELAARNGERFRVKIVLPVHPEGEIDKYATQELMHWQYQTLVRGARTRTRGVVAPQSLVGRVTAAVGAGRVAEFLGIYCLRTHATLGGNPLTEQIYVHAKLMIVDDRVVIVGSANINDRSMLGTRDTELNATLVDRAARTIPVDGNPTQVRTLAHELRVKLWVEHLGLSSTAAIIDPVANAGHDLWNRTAAGNTAIYEAVFPNAPSNNHVDRGAQQRAAALDRAQLGRLSGIVGHVAMFPLDWLRNEDLETTGLPDDLFTLSPALEKPVRVA